MTSQLNVDTIVDKAGSGGSNIKIANTSVAVSEGGAATTTTLQGLAKAWTALQTDASSDYVYDSFNNSGHVDNGSGDHTISYTNSFRAAHNYTTGGFQTHTSDSGTTLSMKPYTKATIATGSTRYNALYVHASGAGVADNEYACVTSHGDLA